MQFPSMVIVHCAACTGQERQDWGGVQSRAQTSVVYSWQLREESCGLGKKGCTEEESVRDWLGGGDSCRPETKTGAGDNSLDQTSNQRAENIIFIYLPPGRGCVSRDFSRIHPNWREARGGRGKRSRSNSCWCRAPPQTLCLVI